MASLCHAQSCFVLPSCLETHGRRVWLEATNPELSTSTGLLLPLPVDPVTMSAQKWPSALPATVEPLTPS